MCDEDTNEGDQKECESRVDVVFSIDDHSSSSDYLDCYNKIILLGHNGDISI